MSEDEQKAREILKYENQKLRKREKYRKDKEENGGKIPLRRLISLSRNRYKNKIICKYYKEGKFIIPEDVKEELDRLLNISDEEYISTYYKNKENKLSRETNTLTKQSITTITNLLTSRETVVIDFRRRTPKKNSKDEMKDGNKDEKKEKKEKKE